jgi:ribosome-associated toxin RatA of RatAB toxin-antitoxin module
VVQLGVECNFTNPLYNELARQVAPIVADRLVEAFEGRARERLGGDTLGVD